MLREFMDHVLEELGDGRAAVKLAPSLGQHHDALFLRGYDWKLVFTDQGQGRNDLLPIGELDPWRILREANDLYNQGVDAVDLWEMGECPRRLDRWSVLKRIGDRAFLRAAFGNRTGSLLASPESPLHFSSTAGPVVSPRRERRPPA